jgi:7-cyano-7-deazaguanine synthase
MVERHSTLISSSQSGCVVLVSGGVDSAACIDFYKRQGLAVRGLHVTYGQSAARHEATAATAIANHYRIPLTSIQLVGGRLKSDGELLGRNALLLFIALLEIEAHAALLAIGIHSGTSYFDCSSRFLTIIQSIIDGQCHGRIRVVAPFLEWTKKEIWNYCTERRVPIDLTYSCERGSDHPCGICLSCRDLEALRVCKKLNNST